jgi:hypothetical protein
MPVVEQSGMRLEYPVADEQAIHPNGTVRLSALMSPPHINNRIWFAYRLDQGEWFYKQATREVAGTGEEQYTLEVDVSTGPAVLSYLAFVRRSGITVPRGADSMTSGEARGLKELTVDVSLPHDTSTSLQTRSVDEHSHDSDLGLPGKPILDKLRIVSSPNTKLPAATVESVKAFPRLDQTEAIPPGPSSPEASIDTNQHSESILPKIAADPALANPTPELILTVQLDALTENHAPLVSAIRAMPDIKQAADLARLTEENWKSLIQTQGVGVPPDTPGTNAEEKTQNYARKIVRDVEEAFPGLVVAERLGGSLGKFLKDHPSFDLKTTNRDQFFKKNPAAAQVLPPEERDRLPTLQLMYRLTSGAQTSSAKTSKAEEAIALMRQGLRSASQIARMDQRVFAQQNGEIFSAERANEVHQQAVQTNAIAMALLGENGSSLNRTGLHALPKLDTAKQKAAADAEAENPDNIQGIPDWENLFGGFDLCACQDCSSAHGPAAYFVDVLKFLSERRINESSNRSVKDALFDRRPDLGDIELSCENTNTVLPLIDLVNEILENAVSPPPPFAPFTLAPELEAELGQTIATPALAAAFNPPLQSGARVETQETGTRWRIWDEPFAYTIVKENNALKVVARSRQTTGSNEDRRATPQYRIGAAYVELGESVYPLTLPFDLPHEEANVFLTHLGVSRRDLIEALRVGPDTFNPDSPVTVRLATERLGLTDPERKIIIDEPLVPARQPEEFWGFGRVSASPATDIASTDSDPALLSLSTVQELLDRSGLSYAELETLIAAWFINPTKTLTISAKGDHVATCDTRDLQIVGLTADILSRMHRFVRLWHKLGWTIPEVDKSIRAFVPDPDKPVLTNEILVRLDHLRAASSQMRISVAQTLALWKPIDTSEPASLYRRLFYNPAVFKPAVEDFRLRPDKKDLVHTEKLLMDHAAALEAVFRLSSANFALLVDKTDGLLTLGNLSLIYRNAIMARQLGLSVQDLLTAVELTGIDPFSADQSQDTLRFMDVVKMIQKSGFDFAELDYLLRHRFNRASSFVPAESSLAQTITDLRAGLLKVDADSDVEKKKLQESSVVDRVSSALALPADVTGALLGRVSHGDETALQRFLALSAIKDIDLPVSRLNAGPQFETLEKLLKIATILQTLKLPGSQLDWLFRETNTPNGSWLAIAPDPSATPVVFASWFSLIQLQQVRRDLALEDAALEAVLGVTGAVVVAADQPSQLAAKSSFINGLTRWLDWSREDLQTLVGMPDDPADVGLLNAHLPDDYRGLDLIIRLHRAMGLLKRLGVTAAQVNKWCEASVTDSDAKAIRSAAKAKHDDQAWLKIATPLQNSLRDKQREALVNYLAARPAQWKPDLAKADVNDLYSHFLIDVEMSSCQLTSRIKQAMSSVQLFAQRCLMGLEPGVQTSEGKWLQWDWMKNFRVWEANRKIWLYPENWIEPELRDDKSPFFKELENELLQTDLDDSAAEQALLHYLEKLDEVARLEIVGVYEDDEDKVLHVFGRTFHTPHIYYYRRREGTTLNWTPWLKVDLDIQGDHLIPVIWNRKLMLIWPIFTEKTKPTPVIMPNAGEEMEPAKRYWEIQLAWSEYQHGRWSGTNLSEAVSLTAHIGEDDVRFGESDRPRQLTANPFPNQNLRIKETGDPRQDDGDTGDTGGPTLPPPKSGGQTTSTTVQGNLVPADLFSFKVRASDDVLEVRGYLRRDFRADADAGDSQIACPFGEFRFFGCRKIITTFNKRQMFGKSLAHAPRGTKFDRMWFTQSPSKPGLELFDGQFPIDQSNLFTDINESDSILGDASTVNQKHNIAVLAQTPSPFRLLAPHQDSQFLGDRPSFFMDGKRTFMVTSKKIIRLDRSGLFDGNLGTDQHVDFFPTTGPSSPIGTVVTNDASRDTTSLKVLVSGQGGRRTANQVTPVKFPQSTLSAQAPTLLPTREYRFVNFHHPFLCDFEKALNRGGLTALLSLQRQIQLGTQSFEAAYQPATYVRDLPVEEVEFQTGRAYELYNWELFFHIPLLIADRLRANQRFKEAQRWFHFIFDPTGASGGLVPQRYWCFKPFHDRMKEGYEEEAVKAIEEMGALGIPEELKVAVEVWRTNPFSPHAVARLRTTAYQKTVVMKYIDNLMAWGDQLFRRETLESINEATQLYVLAAETLGRRPEVIERNLKPAVQTFNTLELRIGELSNALERIELLIPDAGGSAATGDSSQTPDPPSDTVLYFCVPENDKLLGYWNSVGDRLFKIRHCMNIEGQIRELPLFEPEIDPALLVRARAAGLSIGEVLSDIDVSLPNYRFSVMVQKSNELVAEVRNLGAGLLSVLEKRDAEALSLLRSGQEARLLEAVREIRVKQIDEAEATVKGLHASREMAETRKQYYDSRDFVNLLEVASLTISGGTIVPMVLSQSAKQLASILTPFGVAKIGAPPTIGVETGPAYSAQALNLQASALDETASIMNLMSQLTGRMGEYTRRQDEWDHQANLATIELKQIEQQLTAAEIRLAVAEQELRNHDQQIDNARAVDRFLRDKFTNQDLYQHMIGQVSGLYFQSYQLAYDLAKRAERCMQHELGLKYGETSFIRFGYWDSLKKGLIAGDHLAYDLKRLEIAYLDGNIREYELTKHISLVSLAPEQFLALKQTGSCEFEIPEWLFDLDTPGHYRRRIKMVSVTVPCVTGPYTSVHCKLRLLNNSFRQNADLAEGYDRRPADDTNGPDDRFIDDRSVLEAIVTSTGQNDAGLFEPVMRDERYLPFEGAGAISRWRLELPTQFKTFDYNTISDVILHLRYTARDGGNQLSSGAATAATNLVGDANARPLLRVFSLRHEFPSEWHRFVSSPPSPSGPNVITVDLATTRFPYFVQGREININEARAFERTSLVRQPQIAITPGLTAPTLAESTWVGPGPGLARSTSSGQGNPGPWTFATDSDPKTVDDVFVVFAYGAS